MDIGLCIEMALKNLPFEERIRVAGRIGFRCVEMWFVDAAYIGVPEALASTAHDAGIKITNTVIGSPDGHIGGGLTDPHNRDQWLARARMTMEFNRRANIPATIVCTGNRVPGLSDAEMESSVIEGLNRTVELADRMQINLLLEPLNIHRDHAGYWLDSSDRAASLCRQVGSARLRMLFDCYHMQIMEGNLLEHIGRNLDVIGHFHAAGVPGRHELYNGEVNYAFLIGQIAQLGYRGVFGLEYEPALDDETSLRATLAYLRG